jgi:hypothetical protein
MTNFRVFLRGENGDAPDDVIPVPADASGHVAVEEFDNWVIREIHPTGRGIYIAWEDGYYPLDHSDRLQGFVWPERTGKRWKALRRAQHTAGYLRLYRPDMTGTYQELKPILYIVAGSLSESEYVLLLDRLGELAVSERSAVRAPVDSGWPTRDGEARHWVSNPAVRQALAVMEFFEIFREQLQHVIKAPACQARRVMRRIRADVPAARRSVHAIRQMVSRPGQSHIWLPMLCEDTDTPENRFVAFALLSLGAQVTGLSRSLGDQAARLRQDASNPPRDAGQRARRLWRQGRATAAEAARYLDDLEARLEEAREWSKEQLARPFLKDSRVKARPPRHPSLRLTRSPGYGAIYDAYRRVFGSDRIELKLDTVRRGLSERTIRPTWKLYELWLFLETYALLVERFSFRPVGDEPVAHLELQMGRLQLERGQTYELELVPHNDGDAGSYRIRLTYEPPVEYPPCVPGKRCYLGDRCRELPCFQPEKKPYPFGPDVVIETEHEGRKHMFALDAKYRNYADQPLLVREAKKYDVVSNYEIDVLGTAKQKYLDGIGYDAAFVVHSDSGQGYTYFGETTFEPIPHRERAAGLPGHAGHRYGAVYAAPRRTRNLEKLLKCLLMYHAGWYDICWTCRRRLVPETGEQWQPAGRVSTYFQCKYGHGFWAISHCAGKRHRLIKIGADSFHQVARDDVWNCTCPECGGQLGPRPTVVGTAPEEAIPF